MKNYAIAKNHYSCLPGYKMLDTKSRKFVRAQLMSIFNVQRSRLYDLIKDYYNIPADEKLAVEQLFFTNYSITPEQLWRTWNNDSNLTPT